VQDIVNSSACDHFSPFKFVKNALNMYQLQPLPCRGAEFQDTLQELRAEADETAKASVGGEAAEAAQKKAEEDAAAEEEAANEVPTTIPPYPTPPHPSQRFPPTTYYLLPTTYYLPRTTYYLLPTTYYLLPTTYYLQAREEASHSRSDRCRRCHRRNSERLGPGRDGVPSVPTVHPIPSHPIPSHPIPFHPIPSHRRLYTTGRWPSGS
jgi:hypothetical protein